MKITLRTGSVFLSFFVLLGLVPTLATSTTSAESTGFRLWLSGIHSAVELTIDEMESYGWADSSPAANPERIVESWASLGAYLIDATDGYEPTAQDEPSFDIVQRFARAVDRSDDELLRALKSNEPSDWEAFTKQMKKAWDSYLMLVHVNGIEIDTQNTLVETLGLDLVLASELATPDSVETPGTTSAVSPTAVPLPTETPLPPSPTATSSPTPVPTLTPTPRATATPRPTSTPRPVPTPTRDPMAGWPSSVESIVERDSSTTCDEIGWTAAADSSLTGSNEFAIPACVGNGAYIALCVTTQGYGYFAAPSGYTYVVCAVTVGNLGSGELFVSPFDFSIVDGNGRKYETDFTVMALFDTQDLLDSTSLRTGQSVEGLIGFSVRTSSIKPLRLEIAPLLNWESDEVGTIILSPLPKAEDL